MIIAKDLSFTYPDLTTGLRDVSFEINKGDICFLIGESGSGKTTLLHLLMGILRPTTGNLNVLSRDMKSVHEKEIRLLRREIAPIFQDFRLLDGRSVLDNVMLSLRFLKMNNIKERATSAIERVGLIEKIKTPVENLSYGQRQRVAVARALVREPKLILADEPTGNLDRENAENVINMITDLKSEDTTVIISTHQLSLLPKSETIRVFKVKSGYIEEGINEKY